MDASLLLAMEISIRPLLEADYIKVKRIFQDGMDTNLATLETEAPDWLGWDSRFLSDYRWIAEIDKTIVAWAALSPVSKREVYKGVAEVSVYVDRDQNGKGLGGALLDQLIETSEKGGIWTLQASVFPENQTSVQLHTKRGFNIVGTRQKIGKRNGRWRNVVLMERRSRTVGMA